MSTTQADTVDGIETVLLSEFDGRVSGQSIRRLAVDSVAVFDSAPVRNFVPILALRSARCRANEVVKR